MAGIDVEAGDWKIDFSGNVNAFYVNSSCAHNSTIDAEGEPTTTVAGGLACTGDNTTAVRNGLLPAALVFSATTRQDGFDIGATIGLYPGINSSAAAGVNGAGEPAALATPGIDARQIFLTFGDASWGSVKMGRDIGLFGKDAILDDMTLLGVGTAGPGAPAPGNTSLGRIGLGYIYTDWEPQITYTSPNIMGFTVSVGAFQPLDDGDYTSHNSPQWQAGAAYTWGDPKSDPVTGKVWIDGVTQQAKAPSTCSSGSTFCVPDNIALGIRNNVHGTAGDIGAKVDVAGFEAVVYGYYGRGVGTTGLYILATSAAGEERVSDGGYAQLTYKIDRLKLGASYGVSQLKLAGDEQVEGYNVLTALPTGTYASDLVHRNESGVFGVYYSLTKSLTLVGEVIHTEALAWNNNIAIENDVALGGILFF
ncbi:MAG TPA: porin [Steroidobacteraceae bacterium]|nr:porin [Steroidobacteraceae bacterium]